MVLSFMPFRSHSLVLLDELPLHNLQSANLLLLLAQLIVQQKPFLIQVLQRFTPSFVVDPLTSQRFKIFPASRYLRNSNSYRSSKALRLVPVSFDHALK